MHKICGSYTPDKGSPGHERLHVQNNVFILDGECFPIDIRLPHRTHVPVLTEMMERRFGRRWKTRQSRGEGGCGGGGGGGGGCGGGGGDSGGGDSGGGGSKKKKALKRERREDE